ncbi:MAG: peroxiredoxin family protein [Nitrososphaerales archaeon]
MSETKVDATSVDYNYDTFNGSNYSFPQFKTFISAGDRAPDFTGKLLNGDEITLSSLAGKKNVVLEFASISCPPAVNNSAVVKNSINELYSRYKDKGFEFFLVYVREAHPGEKVSHHKSYDQKVEHATRFKNEEGLQVPIIVDSLDGSIHKKYGMLPNMIYVISKQGLIMYRADWTFVDDLESVFENLIVADQRRSAGLHVRMNFSERLQGLPNPDQSVSDKVLTRAGEKAKQDWDRGHAQMRARRPPS